MNKIDELAKTLIESYDTRDRNKTSPYETTAEVIKVEDGVAWVRIPGGVEKTPATMVVNAKQGDSVRVRVAGGKAYVTGNATAPPTDDSSARKAEAEAIRAAQSAKRAEDAAKTAHTAADSASASAIKAADAAAVADSKAVNAQDTADSILVYDHTYTISNGVATFTAFLYRGGVDIKTYYDPSLFTWYLKTESGETYKGTGYTKTFNISECGYGAEVIGKFAETDDSEALTSNGDTLTNGEGTAYTVRADGDHVKVRELTVSSTIYPTDELMVVGAEDEHLITMQTLEGYLNANLDKQVLFNTASGWDSQTSLVSTANTVYVYTNHKTDSQGRTIAGVKIGDGLAYVVDLPFTDELLTEHIADDVRHITAAERTFWNNKVRCYYTGTDQLIFTTL